MAEKKVTIMVIKVDLNCEKCHKKIKKVLCKIPLCCSPEKIKKMICCEGGDSVMGIEIKVPEKPKPKETEKPKEKSKEPEKSKPEKPVVVIVVRTKPKDTEPPRKKPEPAPVRVCCMECYEGQGGGPCYQGFGRRPPPPHPKAPELPPAPPTKGPEPVPASLPPARVCCMECFEGQGGGPCYQGFERRPPPPPPKAPEPAPAQPPKAPEPVPACPPPVRCCMECYEGQGGGPCYQGFGRRPPCYEGYGTPAPPPCYEAYGRPVYESWGGGAYYSGCRRGCYVGRCDCLNEENPTGCIVM